MARGVITPVTPSRAGVAAATATTGDASNGHTVANDGNVVIIATNTNGSATARTVDFIIKRTVDGVTPDRDPVSIAAGATRWFGPFPTSDYGNNLDIDVSHAEVELQAMRVV